MKKLKVYEILDLIMDGNQPSRIIYIDEVWNYNNDKDDYYNKNRHSFISVLRQNEDNWLTKEIECIFDKGE